MKKVLIPTKLNTVAQKTLSSHGNYEVVQDEAADFSTLAAQHPDTYALIVRSEKVTEEIIDAMPSLKVVIRAGAELGRSEAVREFLVFPGSGGVKAAIERNEARLGERSVADVLRGAGAKIRDSWCGPCFGQGPDALDPGQRAITTFNRNWQNRMGLGGEGYLASPAVVGRCEGRVHEHRCRRHTAFSKFLTKICFARARHPNENF